MSYLRSFGAFWYDFLIGDRPELFVGSIIVLGAVWLAIGAGFDPTAAGGLLVALILGLLGLSVGRATRRTP
jgi:hypothetical protein